MNTSIGKHGYSVMKDELTSTEINKIRKDLTVKPFVNASYGGDAASFAVYGESKRKLYLPRFYGVSEFGNPKSVKLETPETVEMKFTGSLKPKQLPIVKAFMDCISGLESAGGIISVPCGYGKTVLALYLASKIGLKTLVIVHKEFLMNQWKERIEQFLPEVSVGKIQRNVINKDGNQIVIGLLQSISMIDYPEETFSGFGLVIYDECHHLGAEVFSRALMKTVAPYTLGLSATPNRTDGLTKVFCWYLGEIIYKITKREQENVDVNVYRYYHESNEYSKEVQNQMKNPNLPLMINNICSFKPRIDLIVKLVTDCVIEGRKILLLSDRKNHLGILKEEFDNYKLKHPDFNVDFTSGYYLGGMKQEQLEKTEKDTIILGTFAMASEGFDCREPLDTIILASPKSNIEQAVGRILRQEAKDRKFVPLVIDIVDEFSLFPKQGLKRIKFYQKNKYNIRQFGNNGEEIPMKTKKKPKVSASELEFLPDSD